MNNSTNRCKHDRLLLHYQSKMKSMIELRLNQQEYILVKDSNQHFDAYVDQVEEQNDCLLRKNKQTKREKLKVINTYDQLIEFLFSIFYDRINRIEIILNVQFQHHHVHLISNHKLHRVFHTHLQ